tara:strand:+ start:14866 stop:15807 length:942 start_codon:yes stop_codon:yes gene_type:complete
MNVKECFLNLVKSKGGFKPLHAHFDKSNVVTPDILMQAQKESMQDKWDTYNKIKASYTFEDIYRRAEICVHSFIKQRASVVRTFADADSIIGQLCIDALLQLKEDYKDIISIEIAIQPIQGVSKTEDYKAFRLACSKADMVGGLPSRDPDPKEHLHILFDIAEEFSLPLDVHVDQLNSPNEKETQLLLDVKETRSLKEKVNAIHSISLACHPESYQNIIAQRLAEENVGVIICPSAGLSMKPLKGYIAPIHNSIAPLNILHKHNVQMALGVDNINDLYMPLVDGNMWFESRLLMEATRCYDLNLISDIATNYV